MKTEILTGLKRNLNGRMVLPTDTEYDNARKVHNGMIDKRPLSIVYCKDGSGCKNVREFCDGK